MYVYMHIPNPASTLILVSSHDRSDCPPEALLARTPMTMPATIGQLSREIATHTIAHVHGIVSG